MVEIGSDASRPLHDVQLSRYACYLIVPNGSPDQIEDYYAACGGRSSMDSFRREAFPFSSLM
jgi:hypothetical protein